jgi:hypothetical protein
MATYDSSGKVYVGVGIATAVVIGVATKTTTFTASTVDFGSRTLTGFVVPYPITSGQVLFNNAGVMGGAAGLTYDAATTTLATANTATLLRNVGNGTVAVPSYNFISATGSGLYYVAPALEVTKNGLDRMVMNRSGAIAQTSTILSVTLSNTQPTAAFRVHYMISASGSAGTTVAALVGMAHFTAAYVTTGSSTASGLVSNGASGFASIVVPSGAITFTLSTSVIASTTVGLFVSVLTSTLTTPTFTINYSVDILSNTNPTITYNI